MEWVDDNAQLDDEGMDADNEDNEDPAVTKEGLNRQPMSHSSGQSDFMDLLAQAVCVVVGPKGAYVITLGSEKT